MLLDASLTYGMGLPHPLQQTLHFQEVPMKILIFTNLQTLDSKSKIPLKLNKLEEMIMERQTKMFTEHWQNDFDRHFFFLFNKNCFCSLTVLVIFLFI